ncbi:MAG: glutaconate CoA-transferase, subunit [Mycobacterium sp.]|nr:glutaconate CoA-transferase, subunit [Mycobacterium sp.]
MSDVISIAAVAAGDVDRRTALMSPAQATSHVSDGMTVGIGGFINSGHPMTLVRQLIRDGRRDLTVVGAASSGLEVDLLIAAGCVGKVISPYIGAEGLVGIGPAYRHAAQAGTIEIAETDEALYYAGLRAAAQCLPFNPWSAGLGTSIPAVNPSITEFDDPITGRRMLAVPAIDIDVCFLHAAVSDPYGNVQHHGTSYGDTALAAAADMVIASVESVVAVETVRANPAATTIPGADGVVRAPFGAHPFSSDGYYVPDRTHIGEYLSAASELLRSDDRAPVDAYLDRYVLGAADDVEYLERVGLRRLLSLHEF